MAATKKALALKAQKAEANKMHLAALKAWETRRAQAAALEAEAPKPRRRRQAAETPVAELAADWIRSQRGRRAR